MNKEKKTTEQAPESKMSFCRDCGKDLLDSDVKYAKYKFGFICCIDCSPMTKYNKKDVDK